MWSSESTANHDNLKYIGGVHISHECAAQVSGGDNAITKPWKNMFSVENNSGLPAVNTLNLLKDPFYRRQSAVVPQ